MRTPSESSISLRFSSRVPNRGSRFGVISRAIFKVFYVLQDDGLRFSGSDPLGLQPEGWQISYR
jgi:hypothetical protein